MSVGDGQWNFSRDATRCRDFVQFSDDLPQDKRCSRCSDLHRGKRILNLPAARRNAALAKLTVTGARDTLRTRSWGRAIRLPGMSAPLYTSTKPSAGTIASEMTRAVDLSCVGE
jgi:hypothetical protein